MISHARTLLASRSATAVNWRATAALLQAPILLGLAYMIGAELGFRLTYPQRPVSTFWSPNAILLGAFLLTPVRSWWLLLLLGALPAHMWVELRAGVPLLMVVCWFISNSAEALIGALVIRRFAGRPFQLDSFAHVTVFVVGAVFFATFASSFLDAAFVSLNHWGDRDYLAVWQNRFFANMLATVTVVPFILAWGTSGLAAVKHAPLQRYREAMLLGCGILLVSIFAFGMQQPGSQATVWLLYAPLPLLLWATVRFGPTGVSTAVLAVVLISIWSTQQGRGPFLLPSAEQNALSIQLLFTTVSMALMTLAAVLEERKRAQAASFQKSEQLQLAMDAAHMRPWEWHIPDAPRLLEASQRMLYPPHAEESMADLRAVDLVHAADLMTVTHAITSSVEHGTPLKVEFRVRSPDGSVRWLHSQGKVLLDEGNRPARMIGLTADITERKTAEALRAGENRILEMIASGAALGDILRELVVFIEEETSGMLCSILLLDADNVHMRHGAAPSLPESYVQQIDGLAIGPHVGSCGTAMYRRKRTIVTDTMTDPLWSEFRELAACHQLRACWSTPIISEEGRVLGSFAMYYREPRYPTAEEIRLIDIAAQLAAIAIERKRAESEVHEQRRALAHLSRVAMLGELSGAIAHELNQPLTAVLSNAQAAQRLLARDSPDVPVVMEILDDIIDADRRASEVIARLRPMLVKGQVQLTSVDVGEIVAATLKLTRSDLTAREVAVTTCIDEGLPNVLADCVQLQQVLLNLIINACDAMSAIPSAQRGLVISAHASHDGEAVEISIADCGTGIPEHLMNHIFDPFYSSKEQGLGMGLAICRSIAVAHRGRIWAVNNPGAGATFNLTLPAARAISV